VRSDRVTREFVLKEIKGTLYVETRPYLREKLSNALEWAQIYFSARRWQQWGGKEKVRELLLEEFYKVRTCPDE
jgi:hypothetical protein